LGHQLVVVKASNASEIAPAFDALAQQNIKAVFINADPLFNVNFSQILELAARYAMATISSWEGFAAEGGLISYGTSISEANRLLGVYTGRVLKGEKPANLPVQQSTKFQLVVNLKTAKALGLAILNRSSASPTRSSNSSRLQSEWGSSSARSAPTSSGQWREWGTKSGSRR
jgi:putative ABC transport system substrate-binding protein